MQAPPMVFRTRIAQLLRRLAAALYDWLVLAGLLLFSSFILIALAGGEAMPPGHPGFQAFLGIQVAAYFIGFWCGGGQTLGLRTWRLKVTGHSGRAPTLPEAALRLVLAIFSLLPLGLGFWWILADGEGRSWHDRLSGTRLVGVVPPAKD